MPSKLYRKFIISEDYKILIYAACVDLILAPVFIHFDPFSLKSVIKSNITIGGLYALVVYLFVLLCIAIHNELIEKRKRNDYKNLIELCNLLKNGVRIQKLNSIKFSESESSEPSTKLGKDIKEAIVEIFDWMDDVLIVYRQFDPIRAGIWNVVEAKDEDTKIEEENGISKVLFLFINEKIEKLKEDLEHYSKLLDSNRGR